MTEDSERPERGYDPFQESTEPTSRSVAQSAGGPSAQSFVPAQRHTGAEPPAAADPAPPYRAAKPAADGRRGAPAESGAPSTDPYASSWARFAATGASGSTAPDAEFGGDARGPAQPESPWAPVTHQTPSTDAAGAVSAKLRGPASTARPGNGSPGGYGTADSGRATNGTTGGYGTADSPRAAGGYGTADSPRAAGGYGTADSERAAGGSGGGYGTVDSYQPAVGYDPTGPRAHPGEAPNFYSPAGSTSAAGGHGAGGGVAGGYSPAGGVGRGFADGGAVGGSGVAGGAGRGFADGGVVGGSGVAGGAGRGFADGGVVGGSGVAGGADRGFADGGAVGGSGVAGGVSLVGGVVGGYGAVGGAVGGSGSGSGVGGGYGAVGDAAGGYGSAGGYDAAGASSALSEPPNGYATTPGHGPADPYGGGEPAGGGPYVFADPQPAWNEGAPAASRGADSFGLPVTGRRIEPSPPPQAHRFGRGVLAGLAAGLLVFGATGWFVGRAMAPAATTAATQATTKTAPAGARTLGAFERSQIAVNRPDFAGTGLTKISQGWLPYLSSCARSGQPSGPARNRGEKVRVRCTLDGMSALFVEYDSVAQRDSARQQMIDQGVGGAKLAPGIGPAVERAAPSGRTDGNYVEFAYRLTENGKTRTVSGLWWDDDEAPIAGYLLAFWREGIGGSWEPMRDLWSRYA